MRGVVVLPDRNSGAKKDWSGAFRPEAQAFAKLHGIPDDHVVEVDLGKDQGTRAAELLAAIRDRSKGDPFDVVAFFGHGLTNNLPQFRQVTAPKIVGVFATVKKPDVVVWLAACSTANGAPVTGDGGYADGVRDAGQRVGAKRIRVFGHAKPGHATMMPYVRLFEGLDTDDAGALIHGGSGGRWVVVPGSEHWKKWVRLLKTTDLRHRFPMMRQTELDAELRAAA